MYFLQVVDHFQLCLMGKGEKRRKVKDEKTTKSDGVATEVRNSPETKSSKRKLVDETELKMQRKKKKSSSHDAAGTSKSMSKSTSKEVQLDSLQSIFSTKAETDRTFTLFGGEPPTEGSPESLRPSTVQTLITTIPEQSQKKTLYFFPHYDYPEKNALSLFPVSDEPFFHNRTE